MKKTASILAILTTQVSLAGCDVTAPYRGDTFTEYLIVNGCGYTVNVTSGALTSTIRANESHTWVGDSDGSAYTYEVTRPDRPDAIVTFVERSIEVEIAGDRCPI